MNTLLCWLQSSRRDGNIILLRYYNVIIVHIDKHILLDSLSDRFRIDISVQSTVWVDRQIIVAQNLFNTLSQ